MEAKVTKEEIIYSLYETHLNLADQKNCLWLTHDLFDKFFVGVVDELIPAKITIREISLFDVVRLNIKGLNSGYTYYPNRIYYIKYFSPDVFKGAEERIGWVQL